MPAERPPRVYWDANVFLSFIEAIPERLAEIESILDAARRRELEIVTSMVTIVEVAFGAQEQAGGALSEEVDERIAALWMPGSPVVPIDFHELIAEEARALVRRGRVEARGIKPMDAIHLASARRGDVVDFHTYDERLQRWSGHLGFPVRAPIARSPRLPGS